jgi:hypothetical protein
MAYDKIKIRTFIQKTLTNDLPGLDKPEAVELLLGTCAQESAFGTYIRQLGGGPALGVFQMERITFQDLQDRFGRKFLIIQEFEFNDLIKLRPSTIMARIKYYSCPGIIPVTLIGQAAYWKRWYNTPLGAGKVEEYLANYRKFVA